MKSILPIISVIGLLGAGGAVTWSVMSRQDDSYITHDVAGSFNLQTGPAPTRAPRPLASGETLRDAVSAAPPVASSLMKPIATPGMFVGSIPKDVPDKRYTVITPRAELWAKKNKFLARLLAKPASFLIFNSALGNVRGMRAFLGDAKKVDAYMNSALVRIALNSPTVAKAILGNPAVIRSFLATPAMSDPQTVRALLASPMVHKMLDCPAILEALSDPVVMNKMITDPQTIQWMAAHPQALMAIASAVPALGDAFSAKTGR